MLALCRKHFSGVAVKDVFVLTYDRMRRYKGAWHKEKKLLFPFCVFLESDNEVLLFEEFNRLPFDEFPENDLGGYGIAKKGSGLVQINSEEETFLKFLYKEQHHLEMSQGVIRNGFAQIIAGPLIGMEQRISKIDRHKRLAKLTLTAKRNQSCGDRKERREIWEQNLGYIMAGLEITEKTV